MNPLCGNKIAKNLTKSAHVTCNISAGMPCIAIPSSKLDKKMPNFGLIIFYVVILETDCRVLPQWSFSLQSWHLGKLRGSKYAFSFRVRAAWNLSCI